MTALPRHTVSLVGGGPSAVLALRRHFRRALGPGAGRSPLVAYVGAASDDHKGFFRMIQGALAATGARLTLAPTVGPRARASETRALLEECDLVFLSGGDVERGMQVLEDRDLVAPLRALGRAGKPMFGVSAGALMLALEWVRFPGETEEGAAIFPCLGIAQVHVDAHSEDDGWAELRVLVRLLHERGDARPVGYGLTGKGGLLVDPGGAQAPVPVGTPIPRIVVRRGKVVDGAPLELPET